MGFWENRRVLVTGGAGFLGSFVVEKLRAQGAYDVVVPRSREYDLKDRNSILRLLREAKPNVVIHLAAVVGGIGANRRHPGKFFHDNAIMGIQLIDEAMRFNVEKFVCIGTVCSYPKHTPVPFREQNLWDGYPEETNAPYGLAKKMLLVQLQAYRQEYGFNGIYLIPVNLYGPRDNFDLGSSHVIPALIHKCYKAVEEGWDRIVAWGTGNATREFLYVEDVAEAIVLAAECYNGAEPVNLGTGKEIRIRDLAHKIAEICGFKGEIAWDSTKPDGQRRRCLDVTRALKLLGWQAKVSLDEGLRRTADWFREHYAAGERKV